MEKYLAVFQLSWQNELVYRLNFLLWRARNILRFLMTFFLWKGIFLSNNSVFGYSQPQMLSYTFMVLALQAIVFSSPSADNIGSEIGSGDLSNYLLKPVGYLKFWFTRDMASKALNFLFAIGELTVLWLLLRPEITFASSPSTFLAFSVSIVFAMVIFYFLTVSARFLAFWTPENTWGLAFLILILVEMLGGSIFPLNILPPPFYQALQFTPFPYLAYFPITILSGKLVGLELARILLQGLIWSVLMYYFTKLIWKKGLVVYQASGR